MSNTRIEFERMKNDGIPWIKWYNIIQDNSKGFKILCNGNDIGDLKATKFSEWKWSWSHDRLHFYFSCFHHKKWFANAFFTELNGYAYNVNNAKKNYNVFEANAWFIYVRKMANLFIFQFWTCNYFPILHMYDVNQV